MQNRQNGRSRRPAAHSSNLAISGLSIENDAPRAARGRAPCASVLEPHNKPKCSVYLCNEKNTMRASTCSKLWSSSMTFYAQIQAISLHLSRAHAAAGPRAFSDACRWAARLHGTRACIRARMSAPELLVLAATPSIYASTTCKADIHVHEAFYAWHGLSSRHCSPRAAQACMP